MKAFRYCLTLIVFSAVCFPGMTAVASIAIKSSTNTTVLSGALVVPGECTITNVAFTGADESDAPEPEEGEEGERSGSAGTFTDGPFGINDGIILASGGVLNALPPNDEDGTSTNFGFPGDSDLDVLSAPNPTFDAAILTLTFDAGLANCISFELVFGSEEFPEFVDTSFNDVYGAFLNSVQLSLDQSGDPITINGSFFSSEKVVEAPLNGLEYDGSTGLLITQAPLTPGSTGNVLKFAVADAGDSILDSGVLLSSLTCTVLETPCEISTEFIEVCNDGIDNDDDGLIDKDDPDCIEICNDGIDNNRDRLVDLDDPDCPVTIDLMPEDTDGDGDLDNESNTIVLSDKNISAISVAILTTSTGVGELVDFDAPALVDLPTVRFGPGGAMVEDQSLDARVQGQGLATTQQGQSTSEDVDGDGDLDLVVEFAVEDIGLPCGNSQVVLTGQTLAGQGFMGSDSIQAVKCPLLIRPPTS